VYWNEFQSKRKINSHDKKKKKKQTMSSSIEEVHDINEQAKHENHVDTWREVIERYREAIRLLKNETCNEKRIAYREQVKNLYQRVQELKKHEFTLPTVSTVPLHSSIRVRHPGNSAISFCGYTDLKESVKQFILSLKYSDLFKDSVDRKTMLLYGPPGTGM
jgi:SpoVK/Ycf46/Vps4 family AAA+-type ATPase